MSKDFKELSWQVSEEEYRKDSAFSYSTLARFAREGFNGLPHLFDKVESPSLTFGSCVDTLITGSDKEFNNKFLVAEISEELSEALKQITQVLYDKFHDKYESLAAIPDDVILESITDIQWNNHWLPKTRVKKIKDDCASYFLLLGMAEGKEVISYNTYRKAMECVDSLRKSESTRFYFESDSVFDTNIQRYYQLKFKATILDMDFRCMPDELIVIHDKKLVVPVDLKTSSKPEWEFPKSFIQWKYYLQANLYTKILRRVMDHDDDYKDYKIASYKFIVINKNTLTPLVWSFSDTVINKEVPMEDPIVLASDLKRYLLEKPKVPFDISESKPNDLDGFLNQL